MKDRYTKEKAGTEINYINVEVERIDEFLKNLEAEFDDLYQLVHYECSKKVEAGSGEVQKKRKKNRSTYTESPIRSYWNNVLAKKKSGLSLPSRPQTSASEPVNISRENSHINLDRNKEENRERNSPRKGHFNLNTKLLFQKLPSNNNESTGRVCTSPIDGTCNAPYEPHTLSSIDKKEFRILSRIKKKNELQKMLRELFPKSKKQNLGKTFEHKCLSRKHTEILGILNKAEEWNSSDSDDFTKI